jgi:hypothetical protein
MSSYLTRGAWAGLRELQTGVWLHASPWLPADATICRDASGKSNLSYASNIVSEVVTPGFISAPRRPSGIPVQSGARLPIDSMSLLGFIKDGAEVRSARELHCRWPAIMKRRVQ